MIIVYTLTFEFSKLKHAQTLGFYRCFLKVYHPVSSQIHPEFGSSESKIARKDEEKPAPRQRAVRENDFDEKAGRWQPIEQREKTSGGVIC